MHTGPRIFCIGLPKTGTRSIGNALRILGYRTIRYPRPLGSILGFQAATDLSIAVNWKFLESVYPHSKFILTTRDQETWHKSCARHFATPTDNTYRTCMFGCRQYDKIKFQISHTNHIARVKKHFTKASTTGTLLTIDIIAGEGWELLCPFLDKPVPDQEFPWTGKST